MRKQSYLLVCNIALLILESLLTDESLKTTHIADDDIFPIKKWLTDRGLNPTKINKIGHQVVENGFLIIIDYLVSFKSVNIVGYEKSKERFEWYIKNLETLFGHHKLHQHTSESLTDLPPELLNRISNSNKITAYIKQDKKEPQVFYEKWESGEIKCIDIIKTSINTDLKLSAYGRFYRLYKYR